MIARSQQEREALLAALLATGLGNRRAFRQVYQMTSTKLFGICLRICGERQTAEDVLQEVYLTIWRRAPSFEPSRGSPVAWLATIARNRALDWRRANNKPPPEPWSEGADTSVSEPVDNALLADRAMIEEEGAARLQGCLEGLDHRPRGAIRAAFLDGLTYSELAKREAVPLATMKSTIRRALLRLRDCLNDDA
ncbi:sigma-70 family RNA polymerase sigma factor [Sphingomonas aerophila]|uniref:RNA polymerase sigma factor n=1 Tax=Sphingomonas aerophila TaxID=1344948 RepID=A0A7W9ETU9_9SPHN|nr:sigma-70 family RNA polymerase sigma factor [Sphingomonas aerophila]MBB5714546.1 RNA polymerase sigma-70 factor (ECF subfamily) [Sphingomonas aerophila]